jgi:hypothetical protein
MFLHDMGKMHASWFFPMWLRYFLLVLYRYKITCMIKIKKKLTLLVISGILLNFVYFYNSKIHYKKPFFRPRIRTHDHPILERVFNHCGTSFNLDVWVKCRTYGFWCVWIFVTSKWSTKANLTIFVSKDLWFLAAPYQKGKFCCFP